MDCGNEIYDLEVQAAHGDLWNPLIMTCAGLVLQPRLPFCMFITVRPLTVNFHKNSGSPAKQKTPVCEFWI
jgi:hypothetical protein